MLNDNTSPPCRGMFHRIVIPNPGLDPTHVTDETGTFSVVSYNILAECHRVRCDYSYTEEKYLCQDYRHQVLLRELLYLDGDVVCLQEVNPEYYSSTLQPALHSHGYDGTYLRRTGKICDEGAATFYKRSRFSLEACEGRSLFKLMKKDLDDLDIDNDVRSVIDEYIDRPDVIHVCRLRCRNSDRIVTIGNLHVIWDDLRCVDVQTMQLSYAVKEVLKHQDTVESPFIICGDLNSHPASPGYQVARDGHLSDTSRVTLKAIKNLQLKTGSESLIDYLDGCCQFGEVGLKSAYQVCQGSEPKVTSNDGAYKACLDYQFYGGHGLEVFSVLEVMNTEHIHGFPTKDIPSDHLSLKATYYFK